MSFIWRNKWSLLGVAYSIALATASLWLATAQPDVGKVVDLWGGAACYVIGVFVAGSFVWELLHNERQLREREEASL